MAEDIHDLIIIGGGAGGLTAGIYASRGGLDTLLLEKEACGGLTASTDLVENYPGFPEGTSGMELMKKFKEQAEKFGTKITEFKEVKKVAPAEGKIKLVTDKEEYIGYAAIVATGSIPKKLDVPGEKELSGKGVSYCATCDGPLFRDQDVAVIGCGNSGLQEGEAALKYVKSVTFVEFLPYMIAEKILQERLTKRENTKFLLNHVVTSINGKDFVEHIMVKDRASGEEKKIDVTGVFIYVGWLPNSKFLEGVVELDKFGYVITNEKMETSVPGIYTIGDVRSKEVRQIDIACGEGTIAAIYAGHYINEIKKEK